MLISDTGSYQWHQAMQGFSIQRDASNRVVKTALAGNVQTVAINDSINRTKY